LYGVEEGGGLRDEEAIVGGGRREGVQGHCEGEE
jgi:hypothetical protein